MGGALWPKPRRMGGGRGGDERHRGGWVLHQRRQPLRLRQRARGQARIDQRHRHPLPRALRHHVRPHFGFHQDAEARREMPQKTRDHPAGVVRQITLHDARAMPAEQRAAGGAPGRRHVREQHRVRRIRVQQRVEQRLGRARLADRDRMQPDHRHRPVKRNATVEAEPFAHMRPVARLLEADRPQAQTPLAHNSHAANGDEQAIE